MLHENTLQSDWDPILTPSMYEYALVRQVDSILQIKLGGYVVNLDAKCIPQLRKILAKLDNKLETLA